MSFRLYVDILEQLPSLTWEPRAEKSKRFYCWTHWKHWPYPEFHVSCLLTVSFWTVTMRLAAPYKNHQTVLLPEEELPVCSWHQLTVHVISMGIQMAPLWRMSTVPINVLHWRPHLSLHSIKPAWLGNNLFNLFIWILMSNYVDKYHLGKNLKRKNFQFLEAWRLFHIWV